MIIRPNGPSRPRRESLRPRGFSLTSPSCRSAAAVNQPANPTRKPKLDRGEHRHTINSGETPPRTAPTDMTQKIVGCLVRCLLVDESVGKPDSVSGQPVARGDTTNAAVTSGLPPDDDGRYPSLINVLRTFCGPIKINNLSGPTGAGTPIGPGDPL